MAEDKKLSLKKFIAEINKGRDITMKRIEELFSRLDSQAVKDIEKAFGEPIHEIEAKFVRVLIKGDKEWKDGLN